MPKPAKLHAVREREGNVQKKPIPASVKLPPGAPAEPDWAEPFPLPALIASPGRKPARPRAIRSASAPAEERQAAELATLSWHLAVAEWAERRRACDEAKQLRNQMKRCRVVAAQVWSEIVPVLDAQGLLATVDGRALADHCVLVARLDQAERDISLRGITVMGDRGGRVRNPSTVLAMSCREKDRAFQQMFGLTPGDRDKLNPRKGDESGDGLFDA